MLTYIEKYNYYSLTWTESLTWVLGTGYVWLISTRDVKVSRNKSLRLWWITTLAALLMGARSFSRSSPYSVEFNLKKKRWNKMLPWLSIQIPWLYIAEVNIREVNPQKSHLGWHILVRLNTQWAFCFLFLFSWFWFCHNLNRTCCRPSYLCQIADSMFQTLAKTSYKNKGRLLKLSVWTKAIQVHKSCINCKLLPAQFLSTFLMPIYSVHI